MNDYISILSCLKGRTIENVTAKLTETGATEINLFFTDGGQVNLFSSITFHGNEEHASISEIQIDEEKV